MSEPVSNSEVEDVLASIRRLVSDDHRPSRPIVTVAEDAHPVEAEKLVLTPSLRVMELMQDASEEGETAETVEDAPDPAPELSETDTALQELEAWSAQDSPEELPADILPDALSDAVLDAGPDIAPAQAVPDEAPMIEDAAPPSAEMSQFPWQKPEDSDDMDSTDTLAQPVDDMSQDAAPVDEEPEVLPSHLSVDEDAPDYVFRTMDDGTDHPEPAPDTAPDTAADDASTDVVNSVEPDESMARGPSFEAVDDVLEEIAQRDERGGEMDPTTAFATQDTPEYRPFDRVKDAPSQGSDDDPVKEAGTTESLETPENCAEEPHPVSEDTATDDASLIANLISDEAPSDDEAADEGPAPLRLLPELAATPESEPDAADIVLPQEDDAADIRDISVPEPEDASDAASIELGTDDADRNRHQRADFDAASIELGTDDAAPVAVTDSAASDQPANTLSAKIAALEVLINQRQQDFESETGDEDISNPPSAPIVEDRDQEPDLEDVTPTFSSERASSASQHVSELTSVQPDAETDSSVIASESTAPDLTEADLTTEPDSISAALPASNAGGLDEDLIDEDALRDLVAEIVRQELQGALGERITRNVRKLVRREIHRALAAQELE